jgi:hypothetical protein
MLIFYAVISWRTEKFDLDAKLVHAQSTKEQLHVQSSVPVISPYFLLPANYCDNQFDESFLAGHRDIPMPCLYKLFF